MTNYPDGVCPGDIPGMTMADYRAAEKIHNYDAQPPHYQLEFWFAEKGLEIMTEFCEQVLLDTGVVFNNEVKEKYREFYGDAPIIENWEIRR